MSEKDPKMSWEQKDGLVRITITDIKIEFPQELRPLERIMEGVIEFLQGYYMIDKKTRR